MKKGLCFRVRIFLPLVFISGMVLPVSPVRADGLEFDEMQKPRPPLNALTPPRVEADQDLFLPPEPEVVESPSVEKEDLWSSISQGMILLKPSEGGTISASEDRKQLLGHGDTVYLSPGKAPFSVDQEWVVFKRIKDVKHPKTKAAMGELVYVLGMVKVVDVSDTVATARITRSKEPITRGDRIAFIEQFLPHSSKLGPAPEKGDKAYVVEVREGRKNSAQHDIVYIDRGKEDGVLRGDQFVVIHEGTRSDTFSKTDITDHSLPFRKIGTMVVLATQARTATAKIIQSLEPISKGDTILFDSSK
ncbi:MAG: hypothetical protein ACE5F7_01875 [Nitrospiria bacterium]